MAEKAEKTESAKPVLKKSIKRHFTARELQLTIALLTVIALLGGIAIQTLSSLLVRHYGFSTPFLGVILIVGYVILVAFLAMFFTHRLVGPFKRLEYEMKLMTAGELGRRLSIRSNDDLHVKNFVRYINTFISNFEDMSKEYNRLNSLVSTKLSEIEKELSKEKYDCEKIREELRTLQKKAHEFREKW